MLRRSYPFRPPYHNSPAHFNPHTANPINTPYTAHYPTAFEVYSKPKQPVSWQAYPYSAATFTQPPKPKNLLYYFQDQNGELDLDKMLSTAGQVANTVQKISPVVKQVGDLLNRTE
ncbi:YppG family protein [Lentibacillus sp.]|uniref:YppG family protein n=1 Tax=Lentibacillus sp. TaxID=1925746 RepID=UPI002B4AEDDA|nr:YppG family protein [Lentibacillus sp.]HLS07806.1 YppG family protein [Lentibacillus sp.]